ncbi:Ff.00g012630.m01.CDS01 [Fusarium sp. VM40]|nr:Ff.00g012630.m01.CDS01 [Fusarium sp. VM40]
MLPKSVVLVLPLLVTVLAKKTPSYDGYDLIWEDTFDGKEGSSPDTVKWNLMDWYKNLNGDFQTYTSSTYNLQLSGKGTVRIIPWRETTAVRGWTSGRMESKYVFTPTPGAITVVEARIRVGDSPPENKQGIWPAFWLLGDSHRNGGPIWPACGEIDIMEIFSGEHLGYGAIHCDKNPGGICNENTGISGSIGLLDGGKGWHTWRAVIDRTKPTWVQESVTIYLDGVQFHKVTGARINNEAVWKTIAANKVHFILNVAVGGDRPKDPNDWTHDGMGAGMEVEYVAHYETTGSPGFEPYGDNPQGTPEYAPEHQSQPAPEPPHKSYPPQEPSPYYPAPEPYSEPAYHAPAPQTPPPHVPPHYTPPHHAPAPQEPYHAHEPYVNPVPEAHNHHIPNPPASPDGSYCPAPAAHDPHHGTYGRPGGWGPGSGGPPCPPGHVGRSGPANPPPHTYSTASDSHMSCGGSWYCNWSSSSSSSSSGHVP